LEKSESLRAIALVDANARLEKAELPLPGWISARKPADSLISGALRRRKIAVLVLGAHRIVKLLRLERLRLGVVTTGNADNGERHQKVPSA
jgi:hypothetical protein